MTNKLAMSIMLVASVGANASTITLSPIPNKGGIVAVEKDVESKAGAKPSHDTTHSASMVALKPMPSGPLATTSETPSSKTWTLNTELTLSRNVKLWAKQQERITGKKVNVIWNLKGLIRFEVAPIIEGTFTEALEQLSIAMKNTKIPAYISFNKLTNTVSFNPIIN